LIFGQSKRPVIPYEKRSAAFHVLNVYLRCTYEVLGMNDFHIPVRLERCNTPEALLRRQRAGLFVADGYKNRPALCGGLPKLYDKCCGGEPVERPKMMQKSVKKARFQGEDTGWI
jgi:hypothetical protein